MARKPRPVDPSEGPVQAFAYDLRLVREKDGNPTYRALAGIAGFSATTLSDAAGGVRLPSLEVTLAYVGACGGDVRYWQERWQELDRSLALERGGPEAEQAESAGAARSPGLHTSHEEPGQPEPATLPDDLPGPARGLWPGLPRWSRLSQWSRRSRWSAVATATALAVGCVLIVTQLTGAAGPTATAQPPHCQGTDPTPAAFHGTAYFPTTRIREGASRNATMLRQVVGVCTLEFTGYCLGDSVVDSTSKSPDMRWLEVSGGGVVSSSVIHGNPPSTIRPSRCPDDVPMPSAISVSVLRQPADPDPVELRAEGRDLAIVGFAAFFAPVSATGDSGTSAAKWQQLGLTDAAVSGFPVTWRLGPLLKRPAEQNTLLVAAVACLGGDGPTGTVDALRFTPGTQDAPQRVTLAGADLLTAEHAACSFPNPS